MEAGSGAWTETLCILAVLFARLLHIFAPVHAILESLERVGTMEAQEDGILSNLLEWGFGPERRPPAQPWCSDPTPDSEELCSGHKLFSSDGETGKFLVQGPSLHSPQAPHL